MDPILTHQVVKVRSEVDRLDDPALAVPKTTGVDKENDLHRLRHVDEETRGRVGVHIHQLSTASHTEAGENWDRPGFYDRSQQIEVDFCGFSDEAVLVLVENVCVERALCESMGGHTLAPHCLDERDVLRSEDVASCVEHFTGRDPQAVDFFCHDAVARQPLVELGPAAVEHYRCQSDRVEKGESGCRFFESVLKDGPANFDDGEARLIEL